MHYPNNFNYVSGELHIIELPEISYVPYLVKRFGSDSTTSAIIEGNFYYKNEVKAIFYCIL